MKNRKTTLFWYSRRADERDFEEFIQTTLNDVLDKSDTSASGKVYEESEQSEIENNVTHENESSGSETGAGIIILSVIQENLRYESWERETCKTEDIVRWGRQRRRQWREHVHSMDDDRIKSHMDEDYRADRQRDRGIVGPQRHKTKINRLKV
ncbi:hypothetical protein FQA39_LY13726 [Lamprigera yunnana]|nr:hypothetical protein FQA39_LY13726 [Lamprigera yunnana]